MLALVLFAIAAVGGLIMAVGRFKGTPNPPMPLALAHGGAAAIGLVLLILSVLGSSAGGLGTVALVLFLIAALGGFTLFAHHLKKKPLPVWLMVLHAGVAVVAFLLLLVGTLGA